MRKPTQRAKDVPAELFKLDDFNANLKARIAALALSHPRIEDLVRSHPALLVKLAVDAPDSVRRAAAIALLIDGRSAFDAAAYMGLPRWSAKLHPSVLTAERVGAIPDQPALSTELQNFLPAGKLQQGPWLDAMIAAVASGGATFTAWLARQISRREQPPSLLAIYVAAFYFRASSLSETRLARMMQTRWFADRGFEDTFLHARQWLIWIILHTLLGPDGQRHTWRQAGEAFGYRFDPLCTAEDFKNAAAVSDNCLYRYAETLIRDGAPRVFNITEAATGDLIGHVEIGFEATNGGFIRPLQIRGHHNRPLEEAVHRAVYKWLAVAPSVGMARKIPRRPAGQRPQRRPTLPSAPDARIAENWIDLLDPYVAVHGAPVGFPATPNWDTLDQLYAAIIQSVDAVDPGVDMFARAIEDLTRRVEAGLQQT